MDFVWTCLMVALGWFFGGIVGGATGIGTIMIAMPMTTAMLSPSDAVLLSCLTGLFGTVHLAYSYRKACSWTDIRDIVIGSVPGCILGALILRVGFHAVPAAHGLCHSGLFRGHAVFSQDC